MKTTIEYNDGNKQTVNCGSFGEIKSTIPNGMVGWVGFWKRKNNVEPFLQIDPINIKSITVKPRRLK